MDGALSSHADPHRPPEACTKTAGTAVRNRPESLYETSGILRISVSTDRGFRRALSGFR
jgi:hypothetical protein